MDNRYFVLRYPLSEKEIPTLMGRVVAQPLNPNRKFIPNPEDPSPLNLQSILPNLTPEPIPVESVASINTTNNASLQVRLQQLLSYSSRTAATQSLELKADIERYTLTQNEWKFKKLLENKQYAREVVELIRENGGKAYMVSGFMVCEESTWKRDIDHRSLEAKVKTQDGSLSGMDVNVAEVEAKTQVKKKIGFHAEGDIKDKLVFAIAYDVVGTEWYFEWNATYFPNLRSKLVLKSELRADWSHLSMADVENDDIIDYEEPGRNEASTGNLIFTHMSQEEFDRLQTLESSSQEAETAPGKALESISEVRTTNAPEPLPVFSQAIKGNGMVFCSGNIGWDKDTLKLVDGGIKAQTVTLLVPALG